MKVQISVDVPEELQPCMESVANLTGMSNDAIAQRIIDAVRKGDLNLQNAVSPAIVSQIFPELNS